MHTIMCCEEAHFPICQSSSTINELYILYIHVHIQNPALYSVTMCLRVCHIQTMTLCLYIYILYSYVALVQNHTRKCIIHTHTHKYTMLLLLVKLSHLLNSLFVFFYLFSFSFCYIVAILLCAISKYIRLKSFLI